MVIQLQKILILRFSSLGDIVMTTAAIRCLRNAFPAAQIDMVVREEFVDLLTGNPNLNHVMGFPRDGGISGLQELLVTINRERYDLVYDAHASLRTRLLYPFIRARYQVTFKKKYLRRSLALLFKLPILDSRRFLEKFVDPVRRFGVQYDGGPPEVVVSQQALENLRHQTGIQKSNWIALVPSAQWPGKRWSVQRFRDLAQRLLRETSMRLLVLGGAQDTFCRDIVSGLPEDRYLNLQGQLTLAGSIAAMSLAEFAIANDTGLMHVADALGIPSVLIFGPTSGDLGCLPHHPRTVVVEKKLWCRPCSKNGQAICIRGHRKCLESISVNDVWAGVKTLGLC